jgi:hypothetical protein
MSIDDDLTNGFIPDSDGIVQQVVDEIVSPNTKDNSPKNKTMANKNKPSSKKNNQQHYIPGTQSNPRFDQTELDCYIDLLEEHLPLCQKNWEDVAQLHCDKYPYTNQSSSNLKRKYNLILKMTGPTGNPHCPEYVCRVFGIKNQLIEKSQAIVMNTPHLFSDNFIDNVNDDNSKNSNDPAITIPVTIVRKSSY